MNGRITVLIKYQKGEIAMNAAISSVIRSQSSNPASTAAKAENETSKSTEHVTGGLNTAVESSVSSKFDTLDLSREYVQYKTQSQNSALQDQTSQLNSTVVRYLSGRKDKDVIYNYELYSYTESELLEMMNDGKISVQEYEKEIASREPIFLKKAK
jgi:DNA-directed RNA polymerase alpha subunit